MRAISIPHKPPRRFPAAVPIAGWVLLCLVGCRGESDENTARLEGSVTLDGKPIAEGTINFLPQGAGQASPASARIADGQYQARAVPLGKVLVQIVSTKQTGRTIRGSSEPVPEVLSIIPPKYAQGIPIEVKGDNPRQDFPLTSN